MPLLHHHQIDPFREFARIFSPLATVEAWMPAFDIEETDSAYILRGDVPGTPQKNIEIRIDEGVLSVQGERKVVGEEAQSRHSERPHGQFVRRFHLPSTVDEEGVKAACSDGVLEVRLPKQKPEDTSRLIPIR